MADEKRFAILIDADNIAPKYINSILNEISDKGTITYKRVYCDWTGQAASGWKKVLLKHSLTPIQQYSYTYGKNATDSAMIIDAMDILYGGEVDGFALCSSDSDFTRLAARLREAGKIVIGLGESKTPSPFCAACNEFKFLDRISDDDEDDDAKESKSSKNSGKKSDSKTSDKQTSKSKKDDKDDETSVTPLDKIASALKDIILNSGESNGMDMGELGSRLQKRYPDFDTRNYGYSKFSIFLKTFDFLSMEHIGTSINVMLNVPAADENVENMIIEMVRSHGDKGINLGSLSSDIKNEFPTFNPKEYGYSKFEQYIRSIDALEVKNTTPLNKKVFIR
ncbi:MAG: NYN domain-containing protein [Lachnospiraceae bacterium]|nr:NYN domain-containing protein [Lachnospiraceae bacterium]